MNHLLLLLTIILPLALLMMWPVNRYRAWVGRAVPWAPLPALLLALLASEVTVDLTWLLLGSRWGIDPTGRIFLGFTAALWMAAGFFARWYLESDPARERFDLFFLLTMMGNLGTIISQDMVSFLLFYTLMSLSAYGLITHNRDADSLRAGKTYIVLAVLGEVALFWAVILTAGQTGTFYFEGLAELLADSPQRHLVVALVLVGFGIKLGIMPLHFWLPLAHPAAPTPASAVLSGAMIKTGLLGLLRFLPLGAVAMPDFGAACIIAGILSAFIAVLIGLTQENPKIVLAYSSVSQMGLIAVGVGVALMVPDASTVIGTAILLQAAHHAIAKAALFLGVGVAQSDVQSRRAQILVVAGLLVAGLSLAGLPWTSGFAGKLALKYAAAAAPEPWVTVFKWVLPLTGLTTTLLVARFLYAVWPGRRHVHSEPAIGLVIPWAILTAAVMVLYFVLRGAGLVPESWLSASPKSLWSAVWPLIGAGAVVLVVRGIPLLTRTLRRIRVPAGDLVEPLGAGAAWCGRLCNAFATSGAALLVGRVRRRLQFPRRDLGAIARVLEDDVTAGLLIGLLAVLLFALALA